jgi:orotate phosphoribosyltransferase
MLLKKIKDAAYLEGDFTTRAGKKTSYYIDKYLFETRPEILDPLTSELLKLLPDANTYDRIAAPELGAVSIAAALSIKANKPFVIVKKQTKDYGTKKMIEGKYISGEKVIVIEDILTTAGAALKACDVLESEKLSIIKIIGVIDRQEGASENIKNRGFEMDALFTSTELKAC